MIDTNNLLEYIKNSHLIQPDLKDDLINHFDNLSTKQKDGLIKYFNTQKLEIINLLKTLKSQDICSFEEIKSNLDRLNRDIIKKQELKDKNLDTQNILNLLNDIY